MPRANHRSRENWLEIMGAEDKNQRYQEILKRIDSRRPFGSRREEEKPRAPQDQVLNLLNVYDALADLAGREYKTILCYGPRTCRAPAWSGVVIWYHSKGYHGYQTLNLLGVWAHYRQSEFLTSIGIRSLPYRAPVYDPGVYRVAIQNNFKIYYTDDGHPPDKSDRTLYRAPFKSKERLIHRQTLAGLLQKWRREIEAS